MIAKTTTMTMLLRPAQNEHWITLATLNAAGDCDDDAANKYQGIDDDDNVAALRRHGSPNSQPTLISVISQYKIVIWALLCLRSLTRQLSCLCKLR